MDRAQREAPPGRDPTPRASRGDHEQLAVHGAGPGDFVGPAHALQRDVGDGRRAERHLVTGEADLSALGPGREAKDEQFGTPAPPTNVGRHMSERDPT